LCHVDWRLRSRCSPPAFRGRRLLVLVLLLLLVVVLVRVRVRVLVLH
jgi:hypothetical protein